MLNILIIVFVRYFFFVSLIYFVIINILRCRWSTVIDISLLLTLHLLTHILLVFICVLVTLVIHSWIVWCCINHFLHLVLSRLVVLLTTFFLLLLDLIVLSVVRLLFILKVVVASELGGQLSFLRLGMVLGLRISWVSCHLLHIGLRGVYRLSVLCKVLYFWKRINVLIGLMLHCLLNS